MQHRCNNYKASFHEEKLAEFAENHHVFCPCIIQCIMIKVENYHNI